MSALDEQVGGSHYKGVAVQPMVFAERNGLSFLQGCAIKRLCRRHKKGTGGEDVDKAIHELRALQELGTARVTGCQVSVLDLAVANGLSTAEAECVKHICYATLDRAIEALESLR